MVMVLAVLIAEGGEFCSVSAAMFLEVFDASGTNQRR